MTDDMTPVIAAINARLGRGFRSLGRFTAGEQGGAWRLVDADGRTAVVKWRPGGTTFFGEPVAHAVNRLRRHGYPAAEWIAVGELDGGNYVVQEHLPGEHVELTSDTVQRLIDILELQAGHAPTELDRDWSAYVYDEAWDPESSIREYLDGLGAAGRDLVVHVDRLLSKHGPPSMPLDDFVHGDFNTANLLVDGDRIGVIDIEALGHGTRVVDYAGLFREEFFRHGASEAAAALRSAAERVADPGVLATCAAATALDIVRFVHRRQPDNTQPVIDRMHELADYLLS